MSPLIIVIGRDEVDRMDISTPLETLKWLISSPETMRMYCSQVGLSFSGYDHLTTELYEMPEVRDYVHRLDDQFPFWLYFLSRDLSSLQCIALCFLLPFLTEEARKELHPQQLGSLIENRWGPALNHACAAAGHTEAEADEMLESALEYFVSGPTRLLALQGDAR